MTERKIECFEFIDEEYHSIPDEITLENSEAYYKTFTVKCDDEFDNNSFNLSSFGDDTFVINRNRCDLDVYIKPNITPYAKEFHIILTHAQDNEVFTSINIIQPGEIYELSLDNDESLSNTKDYVNKKDSTDSKNIGEFNNLSDEEKQNYRPRYTLSLKKEIKVPFNGKRNDSNYNYYEEKTINITVKGGTNKYRLKSLLRYNVTEEENNENNIIQQKFDNGFIYTLNDNSLTIRSYGMPFLNINNYYEMVLCHANLTELNIVLRVKYVEQVTRRSKKKIQKQKEEKTIKQNPDFYLSKDELRKRFAKKQDIKEEIEYRIEFEDGNKDTYLIKNKTSNFELPFKVYRNNEESNLMVGVFSSAVWCVANTDETNRILKIKIKDRPLAERQSFVKIYIFNKPSVYQSFTIINEPS